MLTTTAVVLCALDFLGRSVSSVPPIRFMQAPPAGVSRDAEGFVRHDPDVIYLITSSQAFRNARRGKGALGHADGCKKLASVIVHEEWHLRHGSDEEGAYGAQLIALMTMRAQPIVLMQVRRSMDAVLAERQRRGRSTGSLARTP